MSWAMFWKGLGVGIHAHINVTSATFLNIVADQVLLLMKVVFPNNNSLFFLNTWFEEHDKKFKVLPWQQLVVIEIILMVLIGVVYMLYIIFRQIETLHIPIHIFIGTVALVRHCFVPAPEVVDITEDGGGPLAAETT